MLDNRLIWWDSLGIGWYPVKVGTQPYDQSYFDKYVSYEKTDIGVRLNRARVSFVRGQHQLPLVDIGIGCGSFIDQYEAEISVACCGYDVNPAGIKWLQERYKFVNPYVQRVNSVSLWDVIEHIPDFPALLTQVNRDVFISTPIYHDYEHVINSKHFRTDEHCWYFTHHGLLSAMAACGFMLIGDDDFETRAGREDIRSYHFRRRPQPGS